MKGLTRRGMSLWAPLPLDLYINQNPPSMELIVPSFSLSLLLYNTLSDTFAIHSIERTGREYRTRRDSGRKNRTQTRKRRIKNSTTPIQGTSASRQKTRTHRDTSTSKNDCSSSFSLQLKEERTSIP